MGIREFTQEFIGSKNLYEYLAKYVNLMLDEYNPDYRFDVNDFRSATSAYMNLCREAERRYRERERKNTGNKN